MVIEFPLDDGTVYIRAASIHAVWIWEAMPRGQWGLTVDYAERTRSAVFKTESDARHAMKKILDSMSGAEG